MVPYNVVSFEKTKPRLVLSELLSVGVWNSLVASLEVNKMYEEW